MSLADADFGGLQLQQLPLPLLCAALAFGVFVGF